MSEADADRRSLERLLERLAGEDARGLLDEARTAARERVRARLTDELAQRMLDRIAGEHMATGRGDERTAAAVGEPAAETTSTGPERTGAVGVYVYAVIAPDAGAVDLAGGIRDAPVRIVESEPDGLRALVSDVPLDEFGDDALKRNLNDLSWVSATAVAHEAVVEAAMRDATLVPMRMCTIFLDDDAVRDMLRREAATLGDALARLRGAHEWGVKVIADREAFAAAIADEGDTQGSMPGGVGGSGEGAGYFAALRLDRVAREEVAAALDERTREIHESIAALATDSRLRPPSNRELGGYEGDMVLNGAYLVPVARTDELRARAASLAERHGAAGISVELTGPWPPYNFSTLAGGL